MVKPIRRWRGLRDALPCWRDVGGPLAAIGALLATVGALVAVVSLSAAKLLFALAIAAVAASLVLGALEQHRLVHRGAA